MGSAQTPNFLILTKCLNNFFLLSDFYIEFINQLYNDLNYILRIFPDVYTNNNKLFLLNEFFGELFMTISLTNILIISLFVVFIITWKTSIFYSKKILFDL